MAYDARALANRILDSWDAQEFAISNKKINKIVYFAHGFSLARLRAGFVVNHIEAWDHGPVVRVVYDAFKKHGFGPISSRATYFDYGLGAEVVATAELRPAEAKLFDKVVAHFVQFSADELEAITHQNDAPWSEVRRTPGTTLRDRIPDSLILSYFAGRYGRADALS